MGYDEKGALPGKLAKDVAEAYDLVEVIVIARSRDNMAHVITYGETKENCKLAAIAGDNIKKQMGFPDSQMSRWYKP